MNKILAWHFVGDTLRDGRDIPQDGEWLEHYGVLAMCASGLHGSRRLIDALQYAPGNTICRVELDGEMMHDDDKTVAMRRRILWRIDGGDILREFARWCALEVAHLRDMPSIVRKYLDEEKRRAARVAYLGTAGAATGDAAMFSAGVSARAAADAAADAAARAAADSAARAAAWAAERDAQNARLEQMVMARKEAVNERS